MQAWFGSQPKDFERRSPEASPELAHVARTALGGDFLTKEETLARKEIVEQRIHVAVVTPKRFRAHRWVIQRRRKPDRRVLIGATGRGRESIYEYSATARENQPRGTDKFKKAKLQRHPSLPAEDLPAAANAHFAAVLRGQAREKTR